jgi:hypothetical protein
MELLTERLRLREFLVEDHEAVPRYAGDPETLVFPVTDHARRMRQGLFRADRCLRMGRYEAQRS